MRLRAADFARGRTSQDGELVPRSNRHAASRMAAIDRLIARCPPEWRVARGSSASSTRMSHAQLLEYQSWSFSSQASAPEIQQHLARGIGTGRAGDAAAGVRAGAAHVQAWQRSAIVAVAEHRPRREQLIQAERAME